MNSKDFIAGKKGYSHAAQEAGLRALIIGLSGFFPLVGFALLFALTKYGDKWADNYWFDREIEQSLAMKRKPTNADLVRKNIESKDFVEKSKFWTQDARSDVLFPASLRKYYPIVGGIYLAVVTWFNGLLL